MFAHDAWDALEILTDIAACPCTTRSDSGIALRDADRRLLGAAASLLNACSIANAIGKLALILAECGCYPWSLCAFASLR